MNEEYPTAEKSILMRQNLVDSILKSFKIVIKDLAGMNYEPGGSVETLREWVDRTVDYEVKPLLADNEKTRTRLLNLESQMRMLLPEVVKFLSAYHDSGSITFQGRKRVCGVIRDAELLFDEVNYPQTENKP